jgi:hypothetical protein
MYPKLKINVYFIFLNIGDLTFGITLVFTGGRTPWASDQLVARPLPKHTTTKTQRNTYTHH